LQIKRSRLDKDLIFALTKQQTKALAKQQIKGLIKLEINILEFEI
jgi:hypothetical protein